MFSRQLPQHNIIIIILSRVNLTYEMHVIILSIILKPAYFTNSLSNSLVHLKKDPNRKSNTIKCNPYMVHKLDPSTACNTV